MSRGIIALLWPPPVVSENLAALADAVAYCDVGDVESIFSFVHWEGAVGVITNQTDIAVAEALGLPGIGSDTARLVTDKGLMRRKQRELGIPVLPFAEVDTLEETEEFFWDVRHFLKKRPLM